VRNWPSAISVRFAAKITASQNYAALLRCSLAMGLKQLWQAAQVVRRAVHGFEQRQIAQLGTIVNVALRKNIAAHYHCFRLTSGLLSWHILDFKHKWLARNYQTRGGEV
jgi:hypothetical protein